MTHPTYPPRAWLTPSNDLEREKTYDGDIEYVSLPELRERLGKVREVLKECEPVRIEEYQEALAELEKLLEEE